MPTVDCVALPDHLSASQLDGKVAVVIDILRATTTIVEMLTHGASCVVPVASVDGARIIAQDHPDALLCGERSGTPPEGFHCGNSPLEYSPERVGGKACVISTTNGTRALHLCDHAHRVLIGSITNIQSLCVILAEDACDVVLVCSGTDGQVSLEDCIGAGLIIEQLGYSATDNAALLMHAARGAIERFGGVRYAIESSFHAKRLIELGFGDDVAYSSQLDTRSVVPEFDPAIGEIHPV